jgi:hypothetical protein
MVSFSVSQAVTYVKEEVQKMVREDVMVSFSVSISLSPIPTEDY